MRTKIFTWLGNYIPQNPWKIFIFGIVLSLLSVALAITHLSLDADQDNLVSENLYFHKRYKDFLREFGDQEYLYLVAESQNNLSEAKSFIKDAALKLKELPDIKEVTYQIDNPALEKSFLLLMDQDQLEALSSMVKDGLFSLKKIASITSLEDLFRIINSELTSGEKIEDTKEVETGFKFLNSIIDSANNSITEDLPYESQLERVFFNGESFDPDGYLVTKNKKFVICMIMPSKNYQTLEVIEGPLKRIRQTIDDVKLNYPDIKAGLTGRPVLAADEMISSNRDMNLATILAILAVGVMFVVTFRSATRPLIAMASLLMGISWTYGFVAVFIGTLNLLSIVFAIILVGASIEYGIHVVARYQEELVKNRNVDLAVKKMLLAIGPADLTSSATTAAAFATLILTNFKALQQLGMIAGVGIVFCLLAMLIVLPAMLVIRDHRKYKSIVVPYNDTPKSPLNIWFVTRFYKYPKPMLITALVFTLLIGHFARNISFNFNLLELQARGLESVKYERKLIDESDESSWFAISIADDPQESNKLSAKYKANNLVKKVEDITTFLPLDQDLRIKIIHKMAPGFFELGEEIKKSEKIMGQRKSDLLVLSNQLKVFDAELEKLETKAFSAGRVDAVEELEGFRKKISLLIKNMSNVGNANDRISKFEKEFIADLHKKLIFLISGMTPIPLTLNVLPDTLKNHFISSKGRYAVYAYPKENIWDPSCLSEFVKAIRSIDADVLGTPIEVFESSRLMIRAFLISGILAFIVILVFTYLDFRSIKASLMATMPLALGGIWMVSIMGMLNIPFNLANFFAIPIIIGIGVDSGVHIIHRLKQEKTLDSIGRATGTSVLLTAMTNAVGFGMMMIASHRGIASLGQIMVIGTVCTAVAALVVMPPIAARWMKDEL